MAQAFRPETPSDGPSWLPRLSDSIAGLFKRIMPAPFRTAQYTTANRPLAADWMGGIIFDLTDNRLAYTDGTAWFELMPYTAGAALTRVNDTNVTVTLGGTPTTALLQATSLTLGWTGQLAVGRGGTGVSSLGNITKTDDTNVTLTLGGTPTGAVITSTSFALGWTGTLSAARGGTGNAGVAWTAFTPAITSGSGTIATVAVTGAYQIVGKLMNVRVTITITLAGTGAGALNVTNMPGTATVREFMGGVEDAVTSNTIVVGKTTAGSTNLEITYSGGATVIATGARVQMTGAYEIS